MLCFQSEFIHHLHKWYIFTNLKTYLYRLISIECVFKIIEHDPKTKKKALFCNFVFFSNTGLGMRKIFVKLKCKKIKFNITLIKLGVFTNLLSPVSNRIEYRSPLCLYGPNIILPVAPLYSVSTFRSLMATLSPSLYST